MVKSVTDYARAWGLISKLSLWKWAIIPGLISLLLGGGIIYGGWQWNDTLAAYLSGFYPSNWWGKGAITSILMGLGFILTLFSGVFVYKNLVIPISAPFLSVISTRIEAHLTQKPVEEPPFLEAIIRGLRLTLRNLWRELFFTLVLLLLGFIPILTAIVPILIFVVQANYAGFGNLDFTLERFFDRRGSISFIRSNRWSAIGNGAVFLGFLLVPIIGLLLSPALSVGAATITVIDKLNTSKK